MFDSSSIIAVLKDLNRLKVDKEFKEIIKNLPNIPALKYFFEFLTIVKESDNIFTILEFLKEEPNRKLLSYHDLADYLHSKFSYLPIDILNAGLDLCDSEFFEEYKKNIHYPQEELFSAVASNNVAEVLKLLFIGINPNFSISLPRAGENNLLSLAILKGNDSIIKLLLDKGAIIIPEDLSEVIARYDLSLAKLLFEYGANPNVFIDEYGRAGSLNPLQLALMRRDIPMIQLLLEKGAWPNIILSNGFTPLLKAAYLKSKKIIDLLLKKGAYSDNDFLQKEYQEINSHPYLTFEQRKRWLEAHEFLKKTIEEYNETNAEPKRKKLV